jgi:hypothetical protein
MLKNLNLLKYWTALTVEQRQYASIFFCGAIMLMYVRKTELNEIELKAEVKEVRYKKNLQIAKTEAKLEACNEDKIEYLKQSLTKYEALYLEALKLQQLTRNENTNN